jgi:hypothetical protein
VAWSNTSIYQAFGGFLVRHPSPLTRSPSPLNFKHYSVISRSATSMCELLFLSLLKLLFILRVGQYHIYTVYIRYFGREITDYMVIYCINIYGSGQPYLYSMNAMDRPPDLDPFTCSLKSKSASHKAKTSACQKRTKDMSAFNSIVLQHMKIRPANFILAACCCQMCSTYSIRMPCST